MFGISTYYTIICTMLCLAVVVFIFLFRFTAGYGMMYNKNWGPALNNKLGWVVMEAPSFITMLAIWLSSPRASEPSLIVIASLFELHYFQRSFIFPFLIRGKSRMPLAIILMGLIFNVINAYMIGGWLFYVSPADTYPPEWLKSPLFILGAAIFFTGMIINISSDRIVRNLRKPGDTAHYIPRGGMYRFVTSANYFGELTEWTGYAILSWNPGALVFVIWTFANLAPRARSIHKKYIDEFGNEYASLRRKYLIPFIY